MLSCPIPRDRSSIFGVSSSRGHKQSTNAIFPFLHTFVFAISTMAGDNPTLATANEATGVEPLNSGPKEPQVPKQEAQNTSDQAPAPFGSLPHGYRPIVLPLHVGNTASVQTASSLPGPHGFEDLLKATLNPSGPARAEELSLSSIKDTNVVDL